MSLEDLTFYIRNGGSDKVVTLEIDSGGITITPEDDEMDLTYHEMHYAISVAFIYLGAYLKEVPTARDFVLEKGHKMYMFFHNGPIEGFKSIKEMSQKEFNEFIRKYDGRDK